MNYTERSGPVGVQHDGDIKGGLAMNAAYAEGQEAFRKGLTLEANPYQGQPEKSRKWEEGWEDAKIDADNKRRSVCSDKLEPIE